MIYKILIVAAALAALLLLPAATLKSTDESTPQPAVVYVEVPIAAEPDPKLLTHAQEIWISALEWCESHGKPEAVNPNDNDGTPSYYSYQFKPGTFRSMGELYGVIPKGHTQEEIMSLMKDTKLQRQIVRDMIKDKSLDIGTQFPGCVRKLGYPPVY